MNKTITIIFVVGLPVVIIGVGVGVAHATGELKDAFVPALTAALVWVTAFYAVATGQIMEASKKQVEASERQVEASKKQVEASERQVAIMLESQFNAAAPVVTLETDLNTPGVVKIYSLNAGKGPALNFRCWIEDTEHPELRVASKAVFKKVIPVTSIDNTLLHGIAVPQEYRLGVGYIRAQYESIFGKTYESCLMFPTDKSPQLEWSAAQEVIKL